MRILLCGLLLLSCGIHAAGQELGDFRHLVHTGTWEEKWPDESGAMQTRTVTAELWSAAMQAMLDAHHTLRIPARPEPYYLDAPLVLKPGQTLLADPTAEIRLKPGTNTCMVRNASVMGSADRPLPEHTKPDTDITIEGGIWTTLATSHRESNGNLRGASASRNPIHGTHGVFLLNNVRHVTVRHITVRQSRAFAVHLANAQEFTVEDVTLDRHRRDGVHVNGPSSHGVIRGVRGDSADDTVALNAWEWQNYAPSYGPIHDVLIEAITGTPEQTHAANSIRLLPGVKRFADGTLHECPIHNITLRRIRDIRAFKLYDQPNLELGRDKDASASIGVLKDIHFESMQLHFPARIEVHADTDELSVQDVRLLYPSATTQPFICIGPKSATYKHTADPSRWVEIFSPDLDCTVRRLSLRGITAGDVPLPEENTVRVIQQQPNPDYPRSLPRGGTGKGIWLR